jgi:hypothetical protein
MGSKNWENDVASLKFNSLSYNMQPSLLGEFEGTLRNIHCLSLQEKHIKFKLVLVTGYVICFDLT